MSAYNVDALIEAFVTEEARNVLVEGLRDAYEHTNPFDPNREADLIVENWLPPLLDRVKREAAAEALEEAADAQSSSFGHSGPYWSPWWLRNRAASIREQATS